MPPCRTELLAVGGKALFPLAFRRARTHHQRNRRAEVTTGGKGLVAGPGEEHDACLRILPDVRPCVAQANQHFRRKRIALLRPVQRNAGDPVALLDDEMRRCVIHSSHRSLSPLIRFITLGWRISMFVGYGRLLATLGMDTVGEACTLPWASAG